MEFTFSAYKNLIDLLRANGYAFCNYHNYKDAKNPCILRHDIDTTIEKAFAFAKFEADIGVRSTYFVLLTGDFYNVFSRRNTEMLRAMRDMGHTIGLHFDESAYNGLDGRAMTETILRECNLLGNCMGGGIDCVSMHRPSRWVLESDLKIPGIVNSYGKEFFHDFKYVSDSRMHWREDVMRYAREKTYPRLHILTHAFWYGKQNCSMHDVLDSFLSSARKDRYAILNANFTDLSSVIAE